MGQRGNRGGQGGPPAITIKGLVQDNESQAPLEFATISLFSMRDSSLVSGGLTGPDGIFELETRPGAFYAVFEYIAYDALTNGYSF